jgi:cytoskeletal protein RodZ
MSLQDRIISRDSSIIMSTTLGQKEIAQTAMKENSRIVEKNIDNQFENNRYMLIVLFILIGVVILLVILSFFNKGPKTVYLKPKGTSSKQNQTATQNGDDSKVAKEKTEQVSSINESINTSPTGAYADDSVIQSDLKNIRQSAVKMSVGQKHGASQIVKDWLDDGGEANDDNTDNKQDETEE